MEKGGKGAERVGGVFEDGDLSYECFWSNEKRAGIAGGLCEHKQCYQCVRVWWVWWLVLVLVLVFLMILFIVVVVFPRVPLWELWAEPSNTTLSD